MSQLDIKRDEELETIITNYGNAQFDCGEHDGDFGSYSGLIDIARKTERAILDYIEENYTRKTLVSTLEKWEGEVLGQDQDSKAIPS